MDLNNTRLWEYLVTGDLPKLGFKENQEASLRDLPLYKLLLIVALHMLLISSVAHVWLLWAGKKKTIWDKLSRWATIGGCATLTVALIVVHVTRETWLFSNSSDLFVLLSLCTVGLYLIVYNRFRTRTLGAMAVPLAALHLTLGLISIDATPIVLEERSAVFTTWTTIHVLAAALGSGLFSISAFASGLYALQDRRLKHHRPAAGHLLPPLDILDRINRLGLNWGYVLFSIGLVLGTVKMAVLKRHDGFYDPLTVVFVMCWLLYSALLAARSTGAIGARRAAIGSIICFSIALSGVMSTKLIRNMSGGIMFHGSDTPKETGASGQP